MRFASACVTKCLVFVCMTMFHTQTTYHCATSLILKPHTIVPPVSYSNHIPLYR